MKYIIEIENEPFGRNDDPVIPHGMDELYRAKGFKSLVFDKNGLNKLTPYTEPDREAIEDEVWEFLDFLFTGMSPEERYECFNKVFSHMIVSTMSYQEAKAKYESWLKQKDVITVGDEVEYTCGGEMEKFIVYGKHDGCYYGYETTDDSTMSPLDLWQYCHEDDETLKKTGRHFPEVAELLKKVKEEP